MPKVSLESALQLLHERGVSFDMGHQIEFHDRVGWNVWGLVLKTTVHVDSLVVIGPDSVPESLNRIEFLPL